MCINNLCTYIRVQLSSTTFTAIQKDGSTTTPGTPSVTDLNVKPPQDVIENSTNQPKPKNGYNLSHKKYSSTKPTPANDDTQSKPKESKTKWSNSTISSIWFTTKRPTRYIIYHQYIIITNWLLGDKFQNYYRPWPSER